MRYEFRSQVWLHTGEAAWHFLTLPTDVADEIDLLTEGEKRGFGSVKVRATIGTSTWETSIFPDTDRGCFVLPVKKAVRVAEGLDDGSRAEVVLRVVR